MKLFRINLNQLEDPRALERRERRENSLFVALGIGFLVLLGVTLYWNSRLAAKLKSLQRTQGEITAQIEALTQDAHYVSEKDVRSLEALTRGRFLWTPKLAAFSALAGDKMALTRLEFRDKLLRISGITEAAGKETPFDRVSGFIERLQADSAFQRDFRRVEFETSRRLVYQNQALQEFTLKCLPR